MLEDKFQIMKKLRSIPSAEDVKLPGENLEELTKAFMKTCALLIKDCMVEKLPKLAVEASVDFATHAQLYRSSGLSGEDRKDCNQVRRKGE
jgi:hypothetical protein